MTEIKPPTSPPHDTRLHRQLSVTDVLQGHASHGCYAEPNPELRPIFRHKRPPTVVCLLKGMATMMFILAAATVIAGVWHMVATDEPYKGGLFIGMGGVICCCAVVIGSLYHGIVAVIILAGRDHG